MCKLAWQVKRSGHCNGGGVTAIRCGGQQLRSAGVSLVMGAIFHMAPIWRSGPEGGAGNCTGWHLDVCNLPSPPASTLLTGNGRSFSSLSACLVYQSALSHRLVVPGDDGPSGARGSALEKRAGCSSISQLLDNQEDIYQCPKSNFELTDRHTHVTCHTDEWRLTAARPTLSVLKGVLNPLMAQWSDREQETKRLQRSSKRSRHLVVLGPQINKRRGL